MEIKYYTVKILDKLDPVECAKNHGTLKPYLEHAKQFINSRTLKDVNHNEMILGAAIQASSDVHITARINGENGLISEDIRATAIWVRGNCGTSAAFRYLLAMSHLLVADEDAKQVLQPYSKRFSSLLKVDHNRMNPKAQVSLDGILPKLIKRGVEFPKDKSLAESTVLKWSAWPEQYENGIRGWVEEASRIPIDTGFKDRMVKSGLNVSTAEVLSHANWEEITKLRKKYPKRILNLVATGIAAVQLGPVAASATNKFTRPDEVDIVETAKTILTQMYVSESLIGSDMELVNTIAGIVENLTTTVIEVPEELTHAIAEKTMNYKYVSMIISALENPRVRAAVSGLAVEALAFLHNSTKVVQGVKEYRLPFALDMQMMAKNWEKFVIAYKLVVEKGGVLLQTVKEKAIERITIVND